MKVNRSTNIFLSILFFIVYLFIYLFLEFYTHSRTEEILEEQEKYLEISYKQGLDRFESIAQNIYYEMQNDVKLLNLVADKSINLEQKHAAIYAYLHDEYKKLQFSGVMGIQIVTPEGISIVRMHAKSRYGGEEFVILLHTDKKNAYRIVEQIRQRVQSASFGEDGIAVTGSFGISECSINNCESVEALIEEADEALYSAKESGRNQVQVA